MKLFFLHPQQGDIIEADVVLLITGEQAFVELEQCGFLPGSMNNRCFLLLTRTGKEIPVSKPFGDLDVQPEDKLAVIYRCGCN